MKRIHPIEEEVEMAKVRLKELQIELKKLNFIRSVLGKELGKPDAYGGYAFASLTKTSTPYEYIVTYALGDDHIEIVDTKALFAHLKGQQGNIVKEIPLTQLKKYFRRKK